LPEDPWSRAFTEIGHYRHPTAVPAKRIMPPVATTDMRHAPIHGGPVFEVLEEINWI
jgi:hypothetical protein